MSSCVPRSIPSFSMSHTHPLSVCNIEKLGMRMGLGMQLGRATLVPALVHTMNGRVTWHRIVWDTGTWERRKEGNLQREVAFLCRTQWPQIQRQREFLRYRPRKERSDRWRNASEPRGRGSGQKQQQKIGQSLIHNHWKAKKLPRDKVIVASTKVEARVSWYKNASYLSSKFLSTVCQ